MLTVTLKELEAMKPCDLARRRPWFEGRESLGVADALEAGASIRDVLWVAGKLGRKDLCVRFALACAQRVAHFNSDPRAQKALDAAQAWLDAPSEETRRAAAAAAASYADASYAAYAAADASYAAYAAYAADASYAAAAARGKEQAAQREILIQLFSGE